MKFADRVRAFTATEGFGILALGAATPGFRSFADALLDGDQVRYLIEDGMEFEIGVGIYDSASNSLTRDLTRSSTGSYLDLSGGATVSVTVASADLEEFATGGPVELPDPLRIGSGDIRDIYAVGTVEPDASLASIRKGSTVEPDTYLGPMFRLDRTFSFTEADVTAGGYNYNSTIPELVATAIFTSTAAEGCDYSAQGLVLVAYNNNSNDVPGGFGRPDAQGMLAMGIAGPDAVGLACGASISARRYNTTSKYTGIEIMVQNWSAVPGTYAATSTCAGMGIMFNAHGFSDSACALNINNIFGKQFDVGLAFVGTVNGGKTGGVSQQSIRDDGNAITSIMINGSHTDGINTEGAAFTGYAFKMAAAHKMGWGDAAFTRGAANRVVLTDGAAGYADLTARAFNAIDSTAAGINAGGTLNLVAASVPTAVNHGISRITFITNTVTTVGAILCKAAESHTGAGKGTQIQLQTAVIGGTTVASRLTADSNGVNLNAVPLRYSGVQVVGAQQPAIANATDAASAITQLNALLAAIRAHGLIAT